MEFEEKELRKEISYAIKNIHGVRQVETATCRQNAAALSRLSPVSLCLSYSRETSTPLALLSCFSRLT